jgi:hypothetical protein
MSRMQEASGDTAGLMELAPTDTERRYLHTRLEEVSTP